MTPVWRFASQRTKVDYGYETLTDYSNSAINQGWRVVVSWSVETFNATVDDEIARMPRDIQSALLRLSERIEAIGLERIGHPHVKHLKGKLWEMRMSGRDGIGRAIYVASTGRRVIILAAFMKKTEKTPRTILALAEQRAKEIEA